MWMEPTSSSLVADNSNYTIKNPFKRGKKRRRNRNGAGEDSVLRLRGGGPDPIQKGDSDEDFVETNPVSV